VQQRSFGRSRHFEGYNESGKGWIMGPLALRVASTSVEAIIAGLAIGGVLLVARKIQLALGFRDDREETRARTH
jgi:hypothetical protein